MADGWLKRTLKAAIVRLNVPVLADHVRTGGTACPIQWTHLFFQKLLGVNRQAYWPVHFTSVVHGARRVRIGVGSAPGASPNCYIQGTNGIEIGDYTLVAPGVGLVSANHSVHDLSVRETSDPIRIGRYCWIGMNAVVLPGVVLGDHTTVAAGAVVSRSFPDGYCVLGGVPARVLRTIDPKDVVERRNEHEYLGFHRLNGKTRDDVFAKLRIERV